MADDNFAEEPALSKVAQPGFRIIECINAVDNWPNVVLR
jgi:hypothetical protein